LPKTNSIFLRGFLEKKQLAAFPIHWFPALLKDTEIDKEVVPKVTKNSEEYSNFCRNEQGVFLSIHEDEELPIRREVKVLTFLFSVSRKYSPTEKTNSISSQNDR